MNNDIEGYQDVYDGPLKTKGMPRCNLCGSINLSPLINFGLHPISHHLLKNNHQFEYTHGVDLRFCDDCGLTQIVDPVPMEKFYTNLSAFSSWKNQPHLSHVIDLINNLSEVTKGSSVLEIASNDGTFLQSLADNGYFRKVGIEPSKDACEIARKRGITTIRAYFNIETAKRFVESYGQADLVIARHIFEHTPNLREMQQALKIVMAPDGYLLLEVPDFSLNLETFDYAIWEEHVNQFTAGTLTSFIEGAGLEINHIETITYCGRAMLLIARNTGSPKKPTDKSYPPALREANDKYRDMWPLFCRNFSAFLYDHRIHGETIAIYGAGNRACTLVNYVGYRSSVLTNGTGINQRFNCFIDDQPEKQGLFMPGSRLPILPGSALHSQKITVCLLAVNAENEQAVIEKHKEWVENGGTFFSICPPSVLLPPFWKKLVEKNKPKPGTGENK